MSHTDKTLPNSDESNSTEHDATISLSGTDEFNDTHSVFSVDTASVSSRPSKHMDTKKTVYKLNRLKEENLLLKESLEKANATDITMLKAKLRGSNADLVRLRQNNAELKDRIQVLEGRLFSALSSQSTVSRKAHEIPTKSVSFADDDKGSASVPIVTVEPVILKVDKLNDGDRAHYMDMIKSLQSRCKHLARLIQSYETKINLLQQEEKEKRVEAVIPQQQSDETLPMHPTVDFNIKTEAVDGSLLEQNPQVPLKSVLKHSDQTNKSSTAHTKSANTTRVVKIQQSEIESLLAQARADDTKMIKELSDEVKRLVALVPRNSIESAETSAELQQSADGDGDGETENISDEPLRHRSRSSSHASHGSASVSTIGRNLNVPSGLEDRNKVDKGSYTSGQLMCSFFAGLLIMMLCVALTSFGSSSVSTGKI